MDLVQALMLIFFLWLFVIVVNSGVTVHHKYKIKQIENQIRYIKGEIEELMQEKKARTEDIENLDGMLSDFLKGEVEENDK